MMTRIRSSLAYLLPSFGSFLWAGIFVIILGLGRRMVNGDGDLGRHITVGNYILDHAMIPRWDVFSNTMAGQPLTPHEWLSEVIFAVAHRLMGLDGPILVSAVVIATALWLVFARMRSESKGLLPAIFVEFLVTFGSYLHWLARPHIFTFLLLAVWMILLYQMRSGRPSRWWLLPVVMLVWANTHGGFLAGPVTWALFGAGMGWNAFFREKPGTEDPPDHFWPSYLLGGATSLLASLVNPAGLRLWTTSIGYITNKYLVSHTIEYLPPRIDSPSTWPFWVFSALLVAALAFKSTRQRAELLVPAAAWCVMAIYSARNIPLFLIVSAPLLARGLQEFLYISARRMKPIGRFLVYDARLLHLDKMVKGLGLPLLCLVLAVGGFRAGVRFDFGRSGNAYDPALFPVEAVNWLQEHPQQGSMFNEFTWGGYLLYRQWPEYKVFIDGQTDFYGESLTAQYLQVVTAANGWEHVLDAHHVDWIILPTTEPVVEALRSKRDWTVVYEDKTSVILRRKITDGWQLLAVSS